MVETMIGSRFDCQAAQRGLPALHRFKTAGWQPDSGVHVRQLVTMLILLVLLATGATAFAQGTVCLVETDEGCTLFIDFYSARFTAYQPIEHGEQRFCNELPGPGTTLFNLEYLHPSLKSVPVDFRIIRNRTNQGRFARWEDVQALGDLDPHTVFYQSPSIMPIGSLNLQVEFPTRGEYLAIVTAGHPTLNKTYHAVFPVSVGARHPLLPLFGFALLGVAAWFYRRTFLAPVPSSTFSAPSSWRSQTPRAL